MIAYQAFAELSQSGDSDERGHAAHLAAIAYLNHRGNAQEHAALYAALVGFLDDPSVKVRAALAFALLHSDEAPRPIILSLLGDSSIIASAVMQHSPILVDADLVPFIHAADPRDLIAIAQREQLSARIAGLLLACELQDVSLVVLRRDDVSCPPEALWKVAQQFGDHAAIRGALLARDDLPARARLALIDEVTDRLRDCRIVKGTLVPQRLEKIITNCTDAAVSAIGEAAGFDVGYVDNLVVSERLNTRTLLHALVNGRVLFFSECLARLADLRSEKVFSILEAGSRPSLSALFARAGLNAPLAGLLVRFIQHARMADLSDDIAARHYVVTALTEELLIQHGGCIPLDLEEAFSYLSEQNIFLARQAARGVVGAFAEQREGAFSLAERSAEMASVLPAA